MRLVKLVHTPLFALAIILGLVACTRPTETPETHAPQPANTLDCLTFNIRYANANDGEDRWARRKEFVRDTIRDSAPDVLAIQEALAHQIDWLLEALPHYEKVGSHRGGGREDEFCGLLVDRRKLRVIERGEFWLSETPNAPGSIGWDAACTRMCVWARVADELGHEILVLGTHLDHRGAKAREESAKRLVERVSVSDLPVVLMGDLNAGEDSLCLELLRSSGLRSAYRAVRPDEREVGTFNGFRNRRDGPKIDYVLISKHFSVLESEIDRRMRDGRTPSDHFPVSARLAW